MSILFCVVLILGICSSHTVFGEQITNLPGLDSQINFKQYSGYITVDSVKNTRLFYWYVESQKNPSSDPLVLWLTGGPGCSSLGGLLLELGPFYVKSNKTLGLNEFSWNKIANMVFLESPAGVGFSKTDQPTPYTDSQTTTYSLQFLLKFFEMYPHLKNLDFWITGESYGGHYVPNLAASILEYNAEHSDNINLKGLMIGNPLTYSTINNGGTVDFIYSHQLISNLTYTGLRNYCNYTFPDSPQGSYNREKCNEYEEMSANEMGSINPYGIYVDMCTSEHRYTSSNGMALLKLLSQSNLGLSAYARQILKNQYTKNLESPYYPCQINYVQSYLSDPTVQKAIHAEPTIVWEECNDTINAEYSQSDFAANMLPIYTNKLFKKGLKILIYSGDVDSVVPATSTRRCLDRLNMKLVKPWAPWQDSRGQVGGYIEVYDDLTYATVRGAGHQVPDFQPRRAFDMFSNFLTA